MLPYLNACYFIRILSYTQNANRGWNSNHCYTKQTFICHDCIHGFHNGVMAYLLQFDEITTHIFFVAWVVFAKTIFSCLNHYILMDFSLQHASGR